MNTTPKAHMEELSQKLLNRECNRDEAAKWLAVLEKQVPHPNVTGCVFWSNEETGPA